MDVLADHSAVFELKTVEALAPKHDAQLLNYLLLADRRRFTVVDDGVDAAPELRRIKNLFLDLVGDWGTGLELTLYTEAMTELLGGEERVIQEIEIVSGTRVAGRQKVHLALPDIVLKITSADKRGRDRFVQHARRFLEHTRLHCLLWINITLHEILFQAIYRQKD